MSRALLEALGRFSATCEGLRPLRPQRSSPKGEVVDEGSRMSGCLVDTCALVELSTNSSSSPRGDLGELTPPRGGRVLEVFEHLFECLSSVQEVP